MKESIMISCPHHPKKKFFKCIKCEDIEVYCDLCKETYRVAVMVDEDGIRTEFRMVEKAM